MGPIKPILFLSTSLLLSCASEIASQERYFDYSGKDGCSPANIGHRLGGDLNDYADNSLDGMKGIASKQGSQCFKNWEFDLSEWKGEIYLSHAPILGDDMASALFSMSEFEKAFRSVEVSKPIIIDLKHLSSAKSLEKVLAFATVLRSVHGNNIWFTVSPDNTRVLDKICSIVSGEFDVMLYRRGGEHCEKYQ